MFTNNAVLRKKTPQHGIDRKQFLENLVEEFHTTTNIESQEQVTANLANFAYDPINFQYIREASALDLFFQVLNLPNERLAIHGIAGLCNICLDPVSRQVITKPENIKEIFEIFQTTTNTEIAINVLTLYYLLISEEKNLKQQICTIKNLERIHYFRNSSQDRLKSLATIFLKDFATIEIEINV